MPHVHLEGDPSTYCYIENQYNAIYESQNAFYTWFGLFNIHLNQLRWLWIWYDCAVSGRREPKIVQFEVLKTNIFWNEPKCKIHLKHAWICLTLKVMFLIKFGAHTWWWAKTKTSVNYFSCPTVPVWLRPPRKKHHIFWVLPKLGKKAQGGGLG